MKKRLFFRTLSATSALSLVLQLASPALPALALDPVTSTLVTVQDITNNSATVCFTLSGNGYGKIHYGTTPNYGLSAQEESASTCNGVSSKIIRLSGLSTGTTYNYKIVSWPSSGTEAANGSSSSNYTFTTLAGDTTPPGAMADAKANLGKAPTVTANSATVYWKTPGDNGWNSGAGPIRYEVNIQKMRNPSTGQYVTLFQMPGDGGFWDSAKARISTDFPGIGFAYVPAGLPVQMGTEQSLIVSGLSPDTDYRIGVIAYDAAGNASPNPPAIYDVKTGPAVDINAPHQIGAVTSSQITTSGFTVSWAAPIDYDKNNTQQNASYYDIRYKEGTSFLESDWTGATRAIGAPTPAAPGTTQSLTINNLKADTNYVVGFKSTDSANNIAQLSISPTIRTLPAPATPDTTAPDRISLTAIYTSAGVSLTWLSPQDTLGNGTKGAATRYEVRYKTSYGSNETEWWQSAAIVPNAPAPVTMNSQQTFVPSSLTLSPSTDYYFSIKAYDAAGNGSLFNLPTLVRTPAVSGGSNNFPSGTARLEVSVSAPATSAPRPAGPVERAVVQLTSSSECSPAGAQGAASGETSNSGYYSFPGVPAGSYKLTVGPPGDNSRTDLMQMNWGCIQLTADTTKNQPVMMPISSGMPPSPTGMPSGTSSITVVVNDYTGGAVSDFSTVEIQFCGTTSTNPCVSASLQKTSASNEYRISNIGAGNYSLRVTPPGSRTDLMTKEWFAISPALAASDQRREYVSLQKREMTPPGGGGLGVGTATLELYVKSPTGNAVDGAMVGVSRVTTCPNAVTPPQGSSSGPTSANGYLAFTKIPAGTYLLGVGPGMSHPELGMIKDMCVTLAENQLLTQWPTLPWSGTPGPGSVPSLLNVSASNMTMSSADITFNVSNASMMKSEYRVSQSDPWTQGPSRTLTSGETGQRMITFTGLKPSTTYYYQLTASNSQGATATYPQSSGSASFATMTDHSNPGSTLPPGNASLTVSVTDPQGVPLVGAMVGVSNCTMSMSTGSQWSSGSGGSSGSTWSSQPCSWAGGRTTMINGRASYIISGIMAREYNIGVSPPDGRYAEFESVTSWPVTLPDHATREETIPLKPKGGTIVSDLPIMDMRMETSPAADVTWITWNTPREADGRVEYGTMQTYELGSFPIPGFGYRHETKLMVKPQTAYYYRVTSNDREGRMGTVSGQFTTPGAGDQLRPFMIDWPKTWPHANERVDTGLREIHVEFTRAIDESSLLPGIASLFTLDKSHSPRAEVKKNFNGFSLVLLEPLKPNSAYMVMIRGSVRAADGVTLGSEQYLQFSTGEPGDGRVGKGAITGVVKLLNGSSVQGATVMLRSEGGMASGFFEQKTQTSPSGDYSFRELPSGTYRIMVYPPSNLGSYNTPPSPPLSVGDNQVIKNDIVLLVSEYVVEGSVNYDDGSPVNDAYVGAWRTEGSQWTPPVPVDAQGHFRLLVGPGAWSIGVMNRPMGPVCDSRTPCPMASTALMAAPAAMILPEYYPDWYPPKPQPVFFSMEDAEKTRTVSFQVSRSRASSSIAGVVLNPDGSGANSATTKVRLFSRTGEKNFSRVIELSSGGAFASPLPPGSYEIRVETSDPDLGSPMPFDVHIAPGEQKAVGTLMLTKTNLSISGTVKKANGKAAPGVRIEGWNKETNETVPDVTNDKGGYRLKVSMGNWIVRVASSERYSGGRESTEFVPASRLPASGIDFIVDENTSLIHGTFKNPDGALLNDVFGYIRVLPGKRVKKPLFMMLPGAPVDRGEFNLSLPEGNYILEFEPPQGSRYFQAKPTSITVESGDTLQVSVVVQESTSNKGATIAGNLVDTSGAIIKSVPFTVYAGANGRWLSAEGDPKTGSYTLPVPPAKKYAIGFEVRSDEYIKSSAFRGKTIDKIEAGETRSMNVTVVRRSVQLIGKVVDSENDAVSDIDVVLASEPFYGGKTTFRDVQSTYSDDDGSFDFRVQPGTYYLRALVPDTSEYVNPEEQRVDVKPGTTGLEVTLTLRSSSVVLRGTTTIAGKAVSARVWATSKTGGYEQDLTGTDGLFELEIAGNDLWRVSAIAEVDRCVFKSSDTPIPVGTKSKIEVNLELFAMRSCLPDPVSMSSDAAKPMVLENETGVKVAIPGNAGGTDGSATLSITPEPAAAGSGAEQFIGHMYDVRYMRATGEEINSFNSNLTLSFPYDRVELKRRGVRPADLAVKYKTGGGWKMLSNCILDEENELLTCSDNHLTEFAIVAPTKVLDVKSPTSKAKVSGATVTLSIGKYDAKKISHLKIYRSAAKGDLGTVIAQKVTKTAFADKPKKGKTFFYTVRAIDKAGNESSSLDQVKVTIKK